MPIPDQHLYRPLFSPWFGHGEFSRYHALAAPRTLVSIDRCHILCTLLSQAVHVSGDIWECGVYQGGTAAMMAAWLRDKHPSKKLFLFDTFAGMPTTDPARDLHQKGDFADTSLESVSHYVGCEQICEYRAGLIPRTFAGLESRRLAFAHVDLDIYQGILDTLKFAWPRLSHGGIIVFDDYGFPTCPGARAAVDEFFGGELCKPLCLPTGQAIVFKGVV